MLARNYLLEAIAGKLSQSSFPFVEASDRMRQHPPPSQQEGVLRGRLAELGIDVLLKRLSDENSKIVMNPIRTPSTTEQYHFSRDAAGNLNVARARRPGERVGDYDNIMVVDGLPTIVEVKVRKYWQGRSRKNLRRNSMSPSSGRVSIAFQPEVIAQKIAPIQEYFRSQRCAYLMILLPEKLRQGTPYKEELTRLGGMLVPFPMAGDDFRDLAGIYLKPFVEGRHLEGYGHNKR